LVDQRIFEATLLLTEQALQNFCQALLSWKMSQLAAARNSNSTKFHYDNWLSNANVFKGFMTRQPVAQLLPRTKGLIHTIIVKEEEKTWLHTYLRGTQKDGFRGAILSEERKASPSGDWAARVCWLFVISKNACEIRLGLTNVETKT